MESAQPGAGVMQPSRVVRVLALIVSLALLAAAIVVVIDHRSDLSAALESVSHPAPLPVAVLLVSMVGSLALTGMLFAVLTRRYGEVGWWRMQQLIAASALLNYLPLRAGMISRIAWHSRVDRIPVIDSTKVVFQAMGVTGLVLGDVAVAMGLWWSIGGSMLLWMIIPLSSIAVCLMVPRLRLLGVLGGIRLADYGCSVARYAAAFALIGVGLSVEAIMLIAAIAMATSMIPLLANGLGVREWVVGLTVVAVSDLPMGVELGIVADIIHRGAELLIVVPLGVVSMVFLTRHLSRQGPPSQTTR